MKGRSRCPEDVACGVKALVLAGLVFSGLPAGALATDNVRIRFPSGFEVEAELAQTPEERERGLMFRKGLEDHRGMLFVFPVAGFYPFWMKNCRFPIDIVWLSGDKRVVDIAASVPPCESEPCPTYGPMRRARYVLEVVAGTAAREGLSLGDVLAFEVAP